MPVDTENDLPDWKPSPQVGESDMSGDKGVDPDDNAPGERSHCSGPMRLL